LPSHPRQQQSAAGRCSVVREDAGQMVRCLVYAPRASIRRTISCQGTGQGRLAVEIAGMFRHPPFKPHRNDLLAPFQSTVLPNSGRPSNRMSRDETVAGELTHFAGEVYPHRPAESRSPNELVIDGSLISMQDMRLQPQRDKQGHLSLDVRVHDPRSNQRGGSAKPPITRWLESGGGLY